MFRDRTFFLVSCCFFLSGLAALIYETAWTHEFAFVFGTSELAVATVLAAYMGGLAAGAALAGRYGTRLARPVLAYGLLELGIAIAALAVPLGIAASRWLYVALFGSQEVLPDAGGLATALFYLACSFVILLVPTAMMGATLPLLVRYSVRSEGEIGRRIGSLYATNTAGAVIGTIAGAFVLLPALGLRATIAAAAAVNALVFAAAWAVARSAPALAAEAAPATPAPADDADGRASWILPLILASGFVSFTYEVLWVRLVGHVVGSGPKAFSTMLASFLLGIAIGAAVAARLASDRRRAALGFAVAQLGIAAFSLVAFAVVNRVPTFADWVQFRGISEIWAHVGACAVTLFPPALCIGATFPFAVRVLAPGSNAAGPASARVYTANTLGSIAGSIAAGFFTIPLLGYEGALILAVAINLALAAATAVVFAPRRPVVLAIAAAGAVALAVMPPGRPWEILRATSMGVAMRAWGPLTYFGVGRSSTVLVTDQRASFSLRTNGLPEAGMPRTDSSLRSAVTHWLTALPIVARPEARSLLLVGFGGGMAIEVVPPSIERIDVVELEPEVIAANRFVAKERWRDPLADPRVHIHLNDARNALLLAKARFDLIVSQPSHPWAGGAAHLYTREFFALAKSRLTPGGVFLQWIGLPFVDEELFRSMLATLVDVFPHVRVYTPPPHGSVLFLASDAPFDMESSVARALAASPEPLHQLGIHTPEDITSNLLLDEAGAIEIARGASQNRDGHNRLASRSDRLGEKSLTRSIDELIAPVDPLVRAMPQDADVFYLVSRLSGARAERVAKALPDPVQRAVAEAIAGIEDGKRVSPQRRLEEALRLDPTHEVARAAMLRLSAGSIADGADPTQIVPAPLSDPERSLADAWVARARNPRSLAEGELETRLAAIPLRHPLGRDAVRLRVQGRLATRDPALIADAVALANAQLGNRSDPSSILLIAEASAAAGDPVTVLKTIAELLDEIDPKRASSRALTIRARDLARATPDDDPDLYWLRSNTLRRLGDPSWRGAPSARPAAEPDRAPAN
jgi:spermidine synthase